MENFRHSPKDMIDSQYNFLTRQIHYWGNSPSFIQGEMTQEDVKKRVKKYLRQITEQYFEECSYVKLQFNLDGYIKWLSDKKEENPDYYKGFNPYDYIGRYEVKYFGYLRFDTPEVSLTGNEMT
tara:strand:+ start:204 stop:575 length:372 start_codon:yes stop_codon:yes gene_type:complete